MTPEQTAFIRTRASYEDKLMKGGASVLINRAIIPTPEQIEEGLNQYQQEQEAALENKFDAHQAVEEHRKVLLGLYDYIGDTTTHVALGSMEMMTRESLFSRIGPSLQHLQHNNMDIGIDMDEMISELSAPNSKQSPVYFVRALDEVLYAGSPTYGKSLKLKCAEELLDQLECSLVDNPHIQPGNKVKVVQTDDTRESDWEVVDIRGDGKLELVSSEEDGAVTQQYVLPSDLLEWNPKPEEETAV